MLTEEDTSNLLGMIRFEAAVKLANHKSTDCRGQHYGIDLGIWQQRGGNEQVYLTSASKTYFGQFFIHGNEQIWEKVEMEMQKLD